MHVKYCRYCGARFQSSRSDAKFHSDACRVGWSKLPSRMKDKAGMILDDLAQMREMAEKYPHLEGEFDAQLVKIQERVARLRLSRL